MQIIDFPVLDSTNKYLKDNFKLYEDFTFVCACYQTSGRGRENHEWISDDGENLLFSLLLKDSKYLKQYSYLPLATAFAIVSVLMKEYDLKNISIKWPNDIYVNNKKICGILLEGSLPNYLVIGVGLNVNQMIFNGDFIVFPTSLKLLTKKTININELKTKIFKQMYVEFEKIAKNNYEFIKYVKEIDHLKNKKCFVTNYSSKKQVRVMGIQNDCSLLIEDENKKINITSGEVFIVDNYY